jgi:prepilin-type processing-associated H-X9-DG protein
MAASFRTEKRGSCSGVTFLDCIAVVAFLSVIAVVLGPAILATAKERSHAIRCLSNVRLHGFAHSIEFKEDGVQYEGWPHLWIRQLEEAYPPLGEARFCPSAPPAARTDSTSGGTVRRAWRIDGGGGMIYEGSYGHNAWFYQNDVYNNDAVGLRKHYKSEAQITRPSRTPVFADSVWVDAWPEPTDRPARNLITGDDFLGGMVRMTIPRHAASRAAAVRDFDPARRLPGAVNVVFADNHVENVPLENLWKLYWHREWEVPVKRPGLP